jgi:sarcosine oxidase
MLFDVAIVGLGAMGSACAHAFAKRGASVIGFDQASPPHTDGSTHGHTRIIREAYYEHPLYVPLVQRAYELWSELERETGTTLFMKTGGLWVGPEKGSLVSGALESARTHGIAHDLLDAAAITRRFPAYRARDEWVGVLEHKAGTLFPEKCVEAFITGARKHNAELRLNTTVKNWSVSGEAVSVKTSVGEFVAKQLVVAAGPWLPGLTQSLGVHIPLEIERQMSHWFTPKSPDPRFSAAKNPVGLWEFPDDMFLTMGDEGHGVKCGKHHNGLPTSPAQVNRVVSDVENAEVREVLEEVMPGAGGTLRDARVCLYTNTPDRHFIIDWAPGSKRVVVVSPCSGHGFKFASAIGEVAAQLALDGQSWIDLRPFSLSRFG